MSNVIDRLPRRVYSQYYGKPKLTEWLKIAREMGGSIADACEAVRKSYDIETATGEQLDVIGRIVVIDRDFINQIEMPVAQFSNGAIDEVECGDTDMVFSEVSVKQDSSMSDELYRILIKAKIIKNNGDATLESISRQAFLLLDAAYISINDSDDMSFSIEFAGADLTPLQRYALLDSDIIQRPQGVHFRGFFELTDVVMFGFDEAEFGDTEAEFSGFSGEDLPPSPPIKVVKVRVTDTGNERITNDQSIRNVRI